MIARDEIAAHFASPLLASTLLDAHRAEVLAEAADKLALELAPERQGAGPGFLLALRLVMRSLRRMADEAATGGA